MKSSTRFLRRSAALNMLFAIEGGSMFFLDVTLAAVLGVGRNSDSLYAAWSLPLTIGRGAFQSLTNSLIGLFADSVDDRLAYSQSITVIASLSITAALLMSITSRWWFPLSIVGADASLREAGVPLAAILSWLIALFAVSETQRAIYYRMEMNVLPSAARVLGTLTSIILIIFSALEQDLAFVALSLVIGAAVEMALGFIYLFKKGLRLKFSWPPPEVLKRMAHVVGLPLLGQGVFISASTAERALASFLGPGTVTAVTYANRIFQMLERFVFRGFVIATIQAYTTSAVQHWRRDTRILLLLSVPLLVIFALMPTAVITVLFERGQFTAEATNLVALALRSYAFAIPIVALNRIPYALAFAQNKSRQLLIYATIFAVTLVGFEIILVTAGVGISAFGIAQIIALMLASVWLYPQVTRGHDAPVWSVEDIVRVLGVAVLAFIGTAFVISATQNLAIDASYVSWAIVLAGGSAALLFTVVAAWLFRVPEATRLPYLWRRKSH